MALVRSPSAKKPELKAAFGGKIEPLGFDRFKTCELMAELLHCSNMGLLNERGAEDEVRKRDKERERLKSEGKLATPRAPASPSGENSHEEFGSSVDSHGFHHAKRPSDDNMSDDDERPDGTRKLEVQNASDEDGFEKVNAPSADDFPDEVNFDVDDENLDQKPTDTTKHDSGFAQSPTKSNMPKPLSPLKPSLYFDPPPTRAMDSPTTASVTDKIDKLDVDKDTVMTEFGEEKSDSDEDGPSELERELAKAHPEDKPAPLFARKEPPAPLRLEDPEETKDIDSSVTTIQGEESIMSNGERAPYETEANGEPVVGDLLKIQFVEHQVVPTILVSTLPHPSCVSNVRSGGIDISVCDLGLLLPLPLEQLPAQRRLRHRPAGVQRHARARLQSRPRFRPLHARPTPERWLPAHLAAHELPASFARTDLAWPRLLKSHHRPHPRRPARIRHFPANARYAVRLHGPPHPDRRRSV